MRFIEINITCFILIAFSLFGCKKSTPDPVDPEDTDTVEVIRVDTVFSVNTGTTLDAAFWQTVQSALDSGNTMVRFAVGEYTLTSPVVLENLGHDKHRLFVQAEATNRVILQGEIPTLMQLKNCRNVRIRGFRFTGKATEAALRMISSNRISLEYGSFFDLTDAVNGAVAIIQPSDSIVIRAVRFEQVGVNSLSHMVDAIGVSRLTILNSYFKDCAGSFVRFRGSLSDRGVLYKNDFISTGTFLTGMNPAFVEVAALNGANPGNERLGTNFMIADNTFSYGNMGTQLTRYAVVFHALGFNPPGLTYQLPVADGERLQNGTAAEKQAILSSHLGLDGQKIHYGNNVSRNVAHNVAYRYTNTTDSAAPWTGVADIEPALNPAGLVTSEEEAIGFYP